EAKAPEECARAAAARAAIVLPHLELGLPLALLDHGFTGHWNSREMGLCRWYYRRVAESPSRLRRLTAAFLLVRAERHAELAEQRKRFVVAVRARDEGDVHPVDRLDRVVVDLGEDHLLFHAQRIVAASVERLRAEPAEVADSRDRDRDETIEELPHPRATQRHRCADLLALAQPEVGDRLLRLLLDRLLAGDDR